MRVAQRSLTGNGKGRSKGKGAGRSRRRTSGKGKGQRGNPKDANGKTMGCDIYHSARQFRRECPQ
eukprot:5198131-Pyramimonas_sp.AAC.2